MSFISPRQDLSIRSALQRVKAVFRDAVDHSVDALSAPGFVPTGVARDTVNEASTELDRKRSVLGMAFNEGLDQALEAELKRRVASSTARAPSTTQTDWQSLSLVDDDQMERDALAERMGQAMRIACDSELGELDRYVGGLLPASERPETDRNPLRPEGIAKSAMAAIYTVVDRAPVRKLLASQIEHELSSQLPALYSLLVTQFKEEGVEPAAMLLRNSPSRADGSTTGGDTVSRPQGLGPGGDGVQGGSGGPQDASGSTAATGGRAQTAVPNGTPIGHVEQDVMSLIRRLAVAGGGMAVGDSQLHALDARISGPGGLPSSAGAVPMANMISAHREELRSATSSALDHMVIDVVGGLFDQILSDPKVPPQMARHLARLQLPVLRAALGDKSFFSSRRHPVRRFVNRIASLAVSFDDFEEQSAQEFLRLVRELVDEIVSGDFDQIEPYEQQLDRLEAFIAEQAKRDVDASNQTGAVLNKREVDLLQHQRYTQQMHAALAPVPMDDFLRQFLTQVWSQAIVHAHREHGESSNMTQRMRAVGRELVLSVQPKATPEDRKQFLMRLPTLMKDLSEGLAMIGWPESAKKTFLAQLLPAHSESLKGGKTVRQLDFNLLARQIDTVMATPVPQPGEAPLPGAPMPSIEEVIAPVFTDDELRRVGLLREGNVDWSGEVDIDLSAEPEVKSADLEIDGLPTTTDLVEPTQGVQLVEHLQIGFSYRMHFEKGWHKVRLSHISPGRTFFVFTRGRDHSEAISMTSRMLHRLCETGRLRAYENAYLIERATARARKQLASLTRPSALN